MTAPPHSRSAPKRAALVFDDGPSPEQREAFLSALTSLKVRATFACIGRQIEAHPELARMTAQAGYEQVNHSHTHPHSNSLDGETLREDLARASHWIEQTTGKRPAWFWPPYLECDDRVNAVVESLGMKAFHRLGFPVSSIRDWNMQVDAATILKNATTGMVDGSVICCHEWRRETLQMLPDIVARLRGQGFTLVTFSELAALGWKDP